MGAGRNTQNLSMVDRVQQSLSSNASVETRNLRKSDLGAVIFSCTNSTMKECLQEQILGLPALHMPYVKNIEPGLPLFLFNCSDRKLHGIFEAASNGQLDINPYAWTVDGSKKTSYPAQVRIRIRKQCQSLSEEQYKHILADNYYGQNRHFWFELDHAQTGAVLSLFESLPGNAALPYIVPMRRTSPEALSNKDGQGEQETSKLAQAQACPNFAPKRVNRLEENQDAVAITRNEKLKSSLSEVDCTHLDCGEIGAGYSSNVSRWADEVEETEILQSHSDKEGLQSEEELIYLKLKQIALARESLNTSPKDHREEVLVPCTANTTNLEDKHSQLAPSVPEKNEVVVINPSGSQTLINQLKREVEDLKVLSRDQFRKSSELERKLAFTDIELQKLRDRVKLLESPSEDSSSKSASGRLELHESETVAEAEPFDEPLLGMKELIFLMGGCDGSGSWLSTAECYSPSRDIVRSLKTMRSTRSYGSAAVSNGHIFNIGGSAEADPSGSTWYDTVDRYNPWINEWTSCPSLSERKGCLACATVHNKIYACGGGNGNDCSSKVEMFDPSLGRWILTQSMLEKRFGAAAVELNGVLYVAGGFYNGNYLKTAERFDPREVSWSKLQSMNTSRGSHSLAVLNEKLYALGGYDGTEMVSSVEVFDPRVGSWFVDREMKQSRGHCFAPVIEDTIYVIGGMKKCRAFADTVECYKEGRGWTVAKLNGIRKRSFFSATLF